MYVPSSRTFSEFLEVAVVRGVGVVQKIPKTFYSHLDILNLCRHLAGESGRDESTGAESYKKRDPQAEDRFDGRSRITVGSIT